MGTGGMAGYPCARFGSCPPMEPGRKSVGEETTGLPGKRTNSVCFSQQDTEPTAFWRKPETFPAVIRGNVSSLDLPPFGAKSETLHPSLELLRTVEESPISARSLNPSPRPRVSVWTVSGVSLWLDIARSKSLTARLSRCGLRLPLAPGNLTVHSAVPEKQDLATPEKENPFRGSYLSEEVSG